MPILVTKSYLCDTDNIDEAYEWTKPTNDKVETYQVGQMRPFDPNAPAQQAPPQRPPLAPVQNLPAKQPTKAT